MRTSRNRSLCVAMLAVTIVALTLTSAPAASRPSGHALQFGVGSSFRLQDFGGTAVAYQRFTGGDVAWRVALGLDIEYSHGIDASEVTGEHDVTECYDVAEWYNRGSLACEWLFYRGDKISVFYGGGPCLTYHASQGEDWDVDPWTGRSYYRRYTSQTWGGGVMYNCLFKSF